MEIKWHNIIGLLLLIVAIYLFVKLRPVMDQFFNHLSYVHYHRYDPLYQVLCLVIFVLTIVAVIRLTSRK